MLMGVALCPESSAAPSSARPQAPAEELFSGTVVPRLRILIPDEGMDTLREYVWDKKTNGQDRTNVLATIREDDRVYTNVAVHLKGGLGSFRPVDDQPGLTLHFDRFAPGQRFHGLSMIYLNNSVQDPSFLSEKICREMFRAAGIPAPRAGHAVVKLNQRNLGLYVLVEGWNKQFLKQHFSNTQGDLYDGGYGNDVTNRLEINSGSFPEDWSRLIALGEAAQEPDLKRRWDRLGQTLDLDRFVSFVAMEVMLAHWDGYTMNKNNFRVFDDLATGRLVFLPHGMDQMFGVFRSTPESSITPQMKSLVSRAVLEVPEGRRLYFERMAQLLTNVFKVGPLTNRVEEIAQHLRPIVTHNPPGLTQFDFAVGQLKMRMAQRAESIARQLREPPSALPFDESGKARLAGWRPQRDSGNPGFSDKSGVAGIKYLEIRAGGGLSYGSWRTTVLLEAGDYEMVGRVQTQGVQVGEGVTRGGVTLRMSGERASKMVASAPSWTDLSYRFRMPALAEVELLCEFRGSSGRARFDLDSLAVLRKQGERAAIP